MKVSIITVAFNSEKTIADSVNSIAEQKYPGIEHIVVDGLSTDRTLDVLRKAARLPDIIISEPDGGIYDAMNKGVRVATGEIICFLNSDDAYADESVIADVAHEFTNEQVLYVYGDIRMCDGRDRVIRDWQVGEISESGLRGRQIPHPAFFVRRHALQALGQPFDSSLKIAADLKQQLILIEKRRYRGAYVNRPLVRMRVGGTSTSSLKSYLKGWRESYDSYNDVFGSGGLWYVTRKVLSKVKTLRSVRLFSK